MEERVKTEHNLATQTVYKHFFYVFMCSFSILHLLFYLQYLSTFKKKNSYLSTIYYFTYFKTFTQVIF